MTSNALSLDVSSASACNSVRCPTCFIASSITADSTLEIVSCSEVIHGPSSTANNITDKLVAFEFINMDDAQTLTIKSAATAGAGPVSQYDLQPLESVTAYC